MSQEIISNKLNQIITFFSYDNIKTIVISLMIFMFFSLLRKVFTKYIFKIIINVFRKGKAEINKDIHVAFRKPVNTFFIVLGFYLSIKYLRRNFLQEVVESVFLEKFFSSSIIVLTAWGFYNLTTTPSAIFQKLKKKFDVKLDRILFPFLTKTFRFIIVFFAIVMILEKWGYDIQGFIAGLGLGGLAFALAAKETASNLFGGIVILLDKPFTIADWIHTPSVEGTVEDISFRSTKVRTFTEGLVTVPNSKLANEAIVNYSRRGKRRMRFNIGVTYSTPSEKIKKCVKLIKEILINNENINNDSIIVNFNEFSESSLDIFIQCYINTSDWKRYLEIKEKINFQIMDITSEQEVEMAFPSTSIYFENLLKIKDCNKINNKKE